MDRPVEMNGNGNKNTDCFPTDNRGKCVDEIDAILLFESTSHKSGFVASGIAIDARFDFVNPF